jgi:hypothetical protein
LSGRFVTCKPSKEREEVESNGPKKYKKRVAPCFVFTPETVELVLKAIKLFEQSLHRIESQSSKVAFAEETVQRVNGKLDAMRTTVGVTCLVTFDYNEKIVLAAAIRLYALELISAPSDAQRDKELQKCRQIEHFALAHLNVKPFNTIQD